MRSDIFLVISENRSVMITSTAEENAAIAEASGFSDPSVRMTHICKDKVSPARNGFKGHVGEDNRYQ